MSDLHLSHTVSDDGSSLKILVSGRLAIDTTAELQHLLLEQINQASSIQIDLSQIDSIDLAGMQTICSACRTSLDAQKHFNITGNMPPDVKKAIKDIGLQRQVTCKHNADLPCIWCGGIN